MTTIPPFPYKRKFVSASPKELLANLRTTSNQLISVEKQDGLVFPAKIITKQDAYRQVNIITDLFTEEARVKARVHGQLTPLEFWERNQAQIDLKMKEFKDDVEPEYAQRTAVYLMCREATTFAPLLSKVVYDLMLPAEGGHVLDPFSGWGDRAIGALGSDRVLSYQGVDCNSSLIPGYRRIVDELDEKKKLNFAHMPFQSFVGKTTYDLIFTSPPYFDFEVYSDEKTQSSFNKRTYREWFDSFMKMALQKMTLMIRPGGYVALHIGSTFRTPTFTDDVQARMIELGMRYVQQIDCSTESKRPIPIWVFQK